MNIKMDDHRSLQARRTAEANTIHGMHGSDTYRAWKSMNHRCHNPNATNYERYGGRGITICDRWKEFKYFYEDMGDKPPGMTLGRKDNDGPYSPENCEWQTVTTQANNRISTRLIEFQGVKLSVAEWSRKTGIPDYTITRRIDRKLPMDQVFGTITDERTKV